VDLSIYLVVMVVMGENMQMKEPTVNQVGEEVKAGTMKPAMEQRQAIIATTGSGTASSLQTTTTWLGKASSLSTTISGQAQPAAYRQPSQVRHS
jgi:hypothetical protein